MYKYKTIKPHKKGFNSMAPHEPDYFSWKLLKKADLGKLEAI